MTTGVPAPPSDLWSMFVSLLPVIVGGVIGVVGGLAGAGYGSRLSEKRENKSTKRDKLEALVTAAYELDIWFKREESALLWNGPGNLESSPLAIVETIAMLHFPELVKEADALSLAAKEYQMWLIDGAQKKVQSNPPLVPKEHMATLQNLYKPFLGARNALLARAKARMVERNAS